jgi:hypothetical protein
LLVDFRFSALIEHPHTRRSGRVKIWELPGMARVN